MKPEGEADDFLFGYRQESSKEKMWRKCKENPFVPFGGYIRIVTANTPYFIVLIYLLIFGALMICPSRSLRHGVMM
jgi:hypothetical protein